MSPNLKKKKKKKPNSDSSYTILHLRMTHEAKFVTNTFCDPAPDSTQGSLAVHQTH